MIRKKGRHTFNVAGYRFFPGNKSIIFTLLSGAREVIELSTPMALCLYVSAPTETAPMKVLPLS
jgi:hypothetical protein